MIRQVFGEESMSRTQNVQIRQDRKRRGEGDEHACQFFFFFFTLSELFTKNLSWQAKHSIPHATLRFYGE
jgi:hypothetical protein